MKKRHRISNAHAARLRPGLLRSSRAYWRIRVLRCSADRAHSDHLAVRSGGAILHQPPRRL